MKKTIIIHAPVKTQNNELRNYHFKMALFIVALIWFAIYSFVPSLTVNKWVSSASQGLAETMGYHVAATEFYKNDIRIDKGNADELTQGLTDKNYIAVAIDTAGDTIRNMSHSLTFFLFYLAVYWRLKNKRKALLAFGIALLCAVLSEYIQSFNDLRTASVIDTLNNMIGASIAFITCMIIESIRRLLQLSEKYGDKASYRM